MKHLSSTVNHFWNRWRSEYLSELREAHYHSTRKTPDRKHPGLSVGEVVIVHDERLPRGFWRLGKIQDTFKGRDGQIRGVTSKMTRRDRHQDLLRRPIRLVYPLEVYPNSPETEIEDTENSPGNISPLELESREGDENMQNLHSGNPQETQRRSQRATAHQADERRKVCMYQLQDI